MMMNDNDNDNDDNVVDVGVDQNNDRLTATTGSTAINNDNHDHHQHYDDDHDYHREVAANSSTTNIGGGEQPQEQHDVVENSDLVVQIRQSQSSQMPQTKEQTTFTHTGSKNNNNNTMILQLTTTDESIGTDPTSTTMMISPHRVPSITRPATIFRRSVSTPVHYASSSSSSTITAPVMNVPSSSAAAAPIGQPRVPSWNSNTFSASATVTQSLVQSPSTLLLRHTIMTSPSSTDDTDVPYSYYNTNSHLQYEDYYARTLPTFPSGSHDDDDDDGAQDDDNNKIHNILEEGRHREEQTVKDQHANSSPPTKKPKHLPSQTKDCKSNKELNNNDKSCSDQQPQHGIWMVYVWSIASLAICSILGESLRVFLGDVFGDGCQMPTHWLYTMVEGANLCIMNTTNTSALFVDLPANLLGCFIMGLLQPTQDLSLPLSPSMNLPWLHQHHSLQSASILLLGLRTGFCGSLTTLSSWNTQLVATMYNPSSGKTNIFSSLFGYLIGLEMAYFSLKLGQLCSIKLFRRVHPHYAQMEDVHYMRYKHSGHYDHLSTTQQRINVKVPDFERRFLDNLLSTEEQEWTEQTILHQQQQDDVEDDRMAHALELLNRWKESTMSHRCCTSNKKKKTFRRMKSKTEQEEDLSGDEEQDDLEMAITTQKEKTKQHQQECASTTKDASTKNVSKKDQQQQSWSNNKFTTSSEVLRVAMEEIEHLVLVQGKTDEHQLGPLLCDIAFQQDWDLHALLKYGETMTTLSSEDGSTSTLTTLVQTSTFLTRQTNTTTTSQPQQQTRLCCCNNSNIVTTPWCVGITLTIMALGLLVGFASGAFVSSNATFYQSTLLSALLAPPGTLCRWKLSQYNGRIRNKYMKFMGTFMANIGACIVSMLMASLLLWMNNKDTSSSTTSFNQWIVILLGAIKTGFAGSMSTVSTFMVEIDKLRTASDKVGGSIVEPLVYVFGTMTIACVVGLVIYIPTALLML